MESDPHAASLSALSARFLLISSRATSRGIVSNGRGLGRRFLARGSIRPRYMGSDTIIFGEKGDLDPERNNKQRDTFFVFT